MSSDDDIVTELRRGAWPWDPEVLDARMIGAADEIERLRAELAKWEGHTGSRCGQQHLSGHDCYRPTGHDGPHVAVLDEVEW